MKISSIGVTARRIYKPIRRGRVIVGTTSHVYRIPFRSHAIKSASLAYNAPRTLNGSIYNTSDFVEPYRINAPIPIYKSKRGLSAQHHDLPIIKKWIQHKVAKISSYSNGPVYYMYGVENLIKAAREMGVDQTLLAKYEQWARATMLPKTGAHGDFVLSNIVFLGSRDLNNVRLIDLETVSGLEEGSILHDYFTLGLSVATHLITERNSIPAAISSNVMSSYCRSINWDPVLAALVVLTARSSLVVRNHGIGRRSSFEIIRLCDYLRYIYSEKGPLWPS